MQQFSASFRSWPEPYGGIYLIRRMFAVNGVVDVRVGVRRVEHGNKWVFTAEKGVSSKRVRDGVCSGVSSSFF